MSIELYRLLAEGEPVSPVMLASRLETIVEGVHRTLYNWPGVFYDSQRRIVGYWGLTLPSAHTSPHGMTIHGVYEYKIDFGPGYRIYSVRMVTASSSCSEAAKRNAKPSRSATLKPRGRYTKSGRPRRRGIE